MIPHHFKLNSILRQGSQSQIEFNSTLCHLSFPNFLLTIFYLSINQSKISLIQFFIFQLYTIFKFQLYKIFKIRNSFIPLDYYFIKIDFKSSLMKTFGQYKVVGNKIGSGAFGQIYPAVNKRNQKVALKIQKSNAKNPQLYYQAKILQLLDGDGKANDRGILKVYEYFTEGEENIMVMKPLGNSLESLFKQYGKSFPLKTIIMIGLQILDRIQYIHSLGFLHRDIKPDNFLIGKEKQSNTVFMIDFGLAKKYQTREGIHIPYKDNKNLTGTARYASINTHLGIEQGRRDDIESLIYVLIYFFLGQLPWQNLDARDKKEKYEKILEKKLTTSVEDLCRGLPEQLMTVLKYIRRIFFDQKPDYQFVRKQLQSVLYENGETNDKVFCWNTL